MARPGPFSARQRQAARNIGCSAEECATSVLRLLTSIDEFSKALATKEAPKEAVAEFLEQYARGVQHVYEQLNSAPDEIVITNFIVMNGETLANAIMVRAPVGGDTGISMTRGFVAEYAKNICKKKQIQIQDFPALSASEAALVEAMQISLMLMTEKQMSDMGVTPPEPESEQARKIEGEHREFILQAIEDFGLGKGKRI